MLGGGRGDGEIHARVKITVGAAGGVRLDHTLRSGLQTRCFRACVSLRWLAVFGILCFESSVEITILTFLGLKNGSSVLRLAQSPFHIISVLASLWKSLSRTNWFQIEVIDESLRGAYLDYRENYIVEPFRYCSNSVTAGRDFGAETSFGIGANLFQNGNGAILNERNYRTSQRITLTVLDRAADGCEASSARRGGGAHCNQSRNDDEGKNLA